ncbi:MAG TPA: stage V sporulation protein E [Halanaerobiales bacterium]|nr:stage V sporulation protein E [Halanaerobiales bacterium]
MNKKSADFILLFAVLILLTIGIIMIFSASSIRGEELFNDSYHFLKRQVIFAVVGIIAMLIMMNIDYHIFQKYAKFIILFSILLLVFVLIPGIGKKVGGSRRWLGVFGFGGQPSEVAKLALIIYIAQFYTRKNSLIKNFKKGILPILIVTGIIFLLILIEPDLGTATLILAIVFIMLFANGAKIWHLLGLAMVSIPAVFYFIFSEPYRKERFLAFLDPWSDPLDTGYHIIQSLLALGSGGLFGVGLGNSHQKFLYLPEPGTDFIFAIIGEELGFLATLLVVLLYLVIAWKGLKISYNTKDRFGSILAMGITVMITGQAILNIAVVTASIPITGITLPFISYGGSSLVLFLFSVGILLNISKNQQT